MHSQYSQSGKVLISAPISAQTCVNGNNALEIEYSNPSISGHSIPGHIGIKELECK